MRTLVVEFQPIFLGHVINPGSPRRHYSYAYIGHKNVTRGDWALVHNGDDFGIVQVKRVVPGIDPKVTKHVIEVLTQEEFEAYKQRNERIDEFRQNLAELEHLLDQDKQLDRYRDLASSNPRAKELFDKVSAVMGNGQATIEATSSASSPTDADQVTERTE